MVPAAGVVYRPFVRSSGDRGRVEQGKVVRPGDRLLEPPDLGAFEAKLSVKAPDAAAIRVGDEVVVTLTALPGRTIAGKVKAKDEFAATWTLGACPRCRS